MVDSDWHIDKDLFSRIADGDAQAFRVLFERFKKKFYSAAYKMSGSHFFAEEMVQETFIRVWQKRSYLREADNPLGYLHTLFYRLLSQQYQKDAAERLRRGGVIDMPYSDELSGEELRALETRYQQLQKAIDQLAPQQARVFQLIKEKGLSREEVARQLDLSPNTVRNHLAEAIKTLKKLAKTGIGLWLTAIQFFIAVKK
ncbi:RNA polymerase sigma factor [Pseudobacter ginsenosidimutans]|uniref:RNA polymerase sigma-70 factor (ECF subfamily) n=1 Tax=Pseudobacter ginsenosidimutans TaxID=661488 RepID=A0A4Q7MDD7_9BACT|nr:sigma-70 family RNA polymerase sigma factor [Pseudobacter ginsenosidimutans]QEC45172.1 sigma-70 family RNA polymerase sigma factor [Pseudobacter ginsenosidimutans]RZS65437.1 RNA polymerase sigma-70 factor (ECF subfamily) [Pseudobacter ginsenosidimutans]